MILILVFVPSASAQKRKPARKSRAAIARVSRPALPPVMTICVNDPLPKGYWIVRETFSDKCPIVNNFPRALVISLTGTETGTVADVVERDQVPVKTIIQWKSDLKADFQADWDKNYKNVVEKPFRIVGSIRISTEVNNSFPSNKYWAFYISDGSGGLGLEVFARRDDRSDKLRSQLFNGSAEGTFTVVAHYSSVTLDGEPLELLGWGAVK
jgi:hypothetical protein